MEAMKQQQQQWGEETDEEAAAGVALKGRMPRQHTNTDDSTTMVTGSGNFVFSSQSSAASSEAEYVNEEAEAESKESPRNGNFVSAKNGGSESPYGISEFNTENVDFLTYKKNPVEEIVDVEVESLSFEKSSVSVTNYQDEGGMKREELPGFSSSPSKQLVEQNGHSSKSVINNGTTENGRVKLREISEQEVSELILERIYEKPASCEFYCPNCKSCITKVIIRGREVESAPPTAPPPPPVDPIRCTSCFSFLIPAGSWFFPKLVPKDEEDHIEEGSNIDNKVEYGVSVPSRDLGGTLQDQTSQTASVTQGSVPNKSVGASVPAIAKPTIPQPVAVEISVPSHDFSETLYGQKPAIPTQSIGVEFSVPPHNLSEPLYGQKPAMPAQSIGVGFSVPSYESSETLYGQKHPVSGEPVEASAGVTAVAKPASYSVGVEVSASSHDSNVTLHNQKSPVAVQPVGVSVVVTTKPPASEIDVVAISGDAPQLEENTAGPAEPVLPESTTVIIDREPTTIPTTGDTKSLEILKSILYGGLTEAITSLGIVTSAASAETATVNILALALANLVGGLFIIGHNLWELKDDQSKVPSSETGEQVDKYQKVLGRRENFPIHAFVAILSFIAFGLVPPLVYAFSFRQSNDRDLKMAAVAIASLLCIIVLAIGKAYIQRPQKYIKTLLYYISIGIAVGGVSYVAGDLIDKLIQKLGWFSSNVSVTLPLPQMGIENPALASY